MLGGSMGHNSYISLKYQRFSKNNSTSSLQICVGKKQKNVLRPPLPPPNDRSKKQKLDCLHRPDALGLQLESQMEMYTIICTSMTQLPTIVQSIRQVHDDF